MLVPRPSLTISLLLLAWVYPKVSSSALAAGPEERERILGILKAANESRFKDWTVEQLEGIEHLNLDLAEINDDQLAIICKLDSLRSLSFMYTQVSDQGIRTLSELRSLQKLVLHRQTSLSEKGLRELAKLEKLRALWLSSNTFDSRRLACLSKLEKLRELNLSDSLLEDEELEAILKGCGRLNKLDLSRTKITDRGLANLHKLSELRFLSLDETQIGDLGFREVCKLSSLQRLAVSGIRVTDKGFEI
mgnify:FL=1